MGLLSEYKTAMGLIKEYRRVIVYAESRYDYVYFQDILQRLLARGVPVTYITSDAGDPLLERSSENMTVLYLKWLAGFCLNRIRANVVIMTMPDLGRFLFRKSPFVKKYAYVFHAAVSTHLQYRKHAFDHYDLLCCTGPYQVDELRRAEAIFGLHQRQYIPYGYPMINDLLARRKERAGFDPEILIAPSWYPGCLFDTCIDELVRLLGPLGFRIRIRPHPEYIKRRRADYRRLTALMKGHPQVSFDMEISVIDSIRKADLLITDRSGIAFEFALGLVRPVLFIDTEPKIMNPDWALWDRQPVEMTYRSRLGSCISPAHLSVLPELVMNALRQPDLLREENMEQIRRELFFDNGEGVADALEDISKVVSA